MDDDVARHMTALLRYANFAKVARDLGVSRQTVMRWSRGEAVTPWQLRRVRELYGVGHEEAAPPDWAERLARETAARVIEALAPADVQLAAARVIERLEALPPPYDEAPADSNGGAAPGGAERQAPGPESRHGRKSER